MIEETVVRVDDDAAERFLAVEVHDLRPVARRDLRELDGFDGEVDLRFGRRQQCGIEILLVLGCGMGLVHVFQQALDVRNQALVLRGGFAAADAKSPAHPPKNLRRKT